MNNNHVVMTVTQVDGSVEQFTYDTANEANEMARQAYRLGAFLVVVRHFE